MYQHRIGHTYTTRRMTGVRLAFVYKCENLAIARALERRLKKLKRKDYIRKIIKDQYLKIGCTYPGPTQKQ